MDELETLRPLLPGARLDVVHTLSDGERSTVRRVRVRDDDGDRTVVVKQFHGAGEGWVRECAALAVLERCPVDVAAPKLLAEAPESALAVLSDLAPHLEHSRGLADDLLGDDAEGAVTALEHWARALAGVHVATQGLLPMFEAELAMRAGDLPVAAELMRSELQTMTYDVERHCGALGVPMPTGTSDQLHALTEQLLAGPSGLTPHDACPDNCLPVEGGFALIDFEGAQWRPVVWDVAYLLVPWPTCWCCWRMPDDAAARAVAAYREVAAGIPGVADPAFERDLEAAVVAWTLMSVSMSLDAALAGGGPDIGPDHPAPTRRDWLVHRMEYAARTTGFPALAQLCGRLATELRGRWGATDDRPTLLMAPAFRGTR